DARRNAAAASGERKSVVRRRPARHVCFACGPAGEGAEAVITARRSRVALSGRPGSPAAGGRLPSSIRRSPPYRLRSPAPQALFQGITDITPDSDGRKWFHAEDVETCPPGGGGGPDGRDRGAGPAAVRGELGSRAQGAVG